MKRFLIERFGRPQLHPQDIVRKLASLANHYLVNGAVFGIRLRIDPSSNTPRYALSAISIMGLTLGLAFGSSMLALACGLILLHPIWAYAIAPTKEPVMENRAYALGLSIAILAAWAASYGPALVLTLLGLYALQTRARNRIWRTSLAFWQQARIENPDDLRAQINFITVLSRDPQNEALAIREYERVIHGGNNHPRLALAVSNLSELYRKQAADPRKREPSIDKCVALLNWGFERWPYFKPIRMERAFLCMSFEQWQMAITELNVVIALDPNHDQAFRARATCYGQLGDEAKMLADCRAAEAIDGIPANITRVHRPVEVAS